MTAVLLPVKAAYRSGEPVLVERRGELGEPGTVTVWHLGDLVAEHADQSGPILDLGTLPPGGYGVELRTDGAVARTAVEVAADPGARHRYGFVASYPPDRDISGVVDTVRRLHLTDVQFYDWAYRHADLLGGGEEYEDALAQPVSLATVRRLASGIAEAGARALGYSAVYAVGPAEWDRWKHRALVTGDGSVYALGDFLYLIDPAADDWMTHYTEELARAAAGIGFDGFHLDQYGYPKLARRQDGAVADLSASFDRVIRGVRERLPEARLVFNNVNDFPTWRTAGAPQDAVYIEVWEPNTTLEALASVVDRARSVADGKPVVLAAYQHVYDSAPAAASDLAASFTMATLFSHGATHLLAGEEDRILVDPYYVRNHRVEPSTADLLARWYDFLVEHDEILMDPSATDVTAAWAGSYNDDCDVVYREVDVARTPVPGAVWRRVVEVKGRIVLHLINLAGQPDQLWDGPKNGPQETGPGRLRIRTIEGCVPRVRVADPDREPRLVDAPVALEGAFATATLPAPRVWQVVVIDLDGRPAHSRPAE